jgi:hypothetical protein
MLVEIPKTSGKKDSFLDLKSLISDKIHRFSIKHDQLLTKTYFIESWIVEILHLTCQEINHHLSKLPL